MKRQVYFPSRQAEQPEWLTNFANKLPTYAPALPLAAPTVTEATADARFLAYVLGDWLKNVRDFAPSCTSAVELLESGTGTGAFVLPVLTPPPLPAGVAAVPSGALDRLFKLVQVIKNSAGYTEAIGLDLGIVGSVAGGSPSAAGLSITAKPVSGPDGERASISFVKAGHMGVAIQCRRGAAGATFQDVATATKSPYTDTRPLLAAGVPEIREYRACYWDDGTASGDWSDVVKVTVSP